MEITGDVEFSLRRLSHMRGIRELKGMDERTLETIDFKSF